EAAKPDLLDHRCVILSNHEQESLEAVKINIDTELVLSIEHGCCLVVHSLAHTEHGWLHGFLRSFPRIDPSTRHFVVSLVDKQLTIDLAADLARKIEDAECHACPI